MLKDFFTPRFPTFTSQLSPLNFHLSTVNCQLSTLSVSALCQPVSPFQTLHALYLSGLCQRVSLICKNLMYVFSADRHPLFIVNAGIVFAIAVGRQVSESAIRCELTEQLFLKLPNNLWYFWSWRLQRIVYGLSRKRANACRVSKKVVTLQPRFLIKKKTKVWN